MFYGNQLPEVLNALNSGAGSIGRAGSAFSNMQQPRMQQPQTGNFAAPSYGNPQMPQGSGAPLTPPTTAGATNPGIAHNLGLGGAGGYPGAQSPVMPNLAAQRGLGAAQTPGTVGSPAGMPQNSNPLTQGGILSQPTYGAMPGYSGQ